MTNYVLFLRLEIGVYEHRCGYAGSGPDLSRCHRAAPPLPRHRYRLPTPKVARSSMTPWSVIDVSVFMHASYLYKLVIALVTAGAASE